MSEILKVRAADGHAFDLALYPARPDAPAILIGPAMGTPARVYAPLAAAFAAQGLNAAVIELRGIGSSSLRAGRRVDYGYRHLVEQDWPAARSALHGRLPAARQYLLGHSLGGQVALLHAAMHPQGVAGAILVAAGSVHYKGWAGARSLGILAFTQFAGALSGLAGYFPGKRVGFGGTEARTLMQDWARLARSGRFALRGGPDYEAELARLRLPVLGLSFEHDVYTPHRAQKNLLDKLRSATVTRLPLSAADTGVRLDHYNWIGKSDAVVSRVAAFVQSVEAAP
ncbi:MAG: alpha/beta fold hydrolase [Gammaproteobacteria bacterium]|nr:alpha/beta fold hydrolase [Gammaproteobacteria bacterium]